MGVGARWLTALASCLASCTAPDAATTDGTSAVTATIHATRDRLRPDSATPRADSIFLAFVPTLRDLVVTATAGFAADSVQAAIWPEGAAAQARWRAESRTERRATADELAAAAALRSELRAQGIWAFRGEGNTYFTADLQLLTDRVGPFLTTDLQAFMQLQVREQANPTADDGSLLISLDELTERLQLAEQHLSSHPTSPVRDVMASRRDWYRAILLTGLPSTRRFDATTGVLDPSWRQHLEAYVRDNPPSETTALVQRYLTLLSSSGFQRSAATDAFSRELWTALRLVPFP
jgi:hypothetical protein